VSDITQTSISLSWSIGNTQHIDLIELYQKPMGASWSTTNISSNSSHTVTSLTPGTTYQFYVKVQSYALTARTNIITVTTGAIILVGLSFRKTVIISNRMVLLWISVCHCISDFCWLRLQLNSDFILAKLEPQSTDPVHQSHLVPSDRRRVGLYRTVVIPLVESCICRNCKGRLFFLFNTHIILSSVNHCLSDDCFMLH